MATQALTTPEQDQTVEKKIEQLGRLFADAPQLGKTALGNALREFPPRALSSDEIESRATDLSLSPIPKDPAMTLKQFAVPAGMRLACPLAKSIPQHGSVLAAGSARVFLAAR